MSFSSTETAAAVTPAPRVLVADDQRDVLESLRFLLKSEGCEVETASSPRQVLEALEARDFDVALVDLNYARDTTSGQEGLDLLRDVRTLDDALPVVVMTAWSSVEVAVEAMRRGAGDFVEKPWDDNRLIAIVQTQTALGRALRRGQRLETAVEILRGEERPDLIAESAAMRPVLELIARVGPSDANILLTGENGTGKSLAARVLHGVSERQTKPLITVNIGGLSESIFESELFGHVKGAFTGAIRDKRGLFRRAEGGTLLLDEIAETSPAFQVGLLRVLQEKEVRPVGGNGSTKVNVRVLAATNRKLDEEVNKGKFRKDLFYRLHVIPLTIPPLRERKEDIPLLAAHFIKRLARTSPAGVKRLGPSTIEALQHYSWPGNVRELQNVLERAVITSMAEEIRAADLALSAMDFDRATNGERLLNLPPGGTTLEAIEKEAILQALRSQGWVQKKAGALLGISPRVMTYKVKKYGITREI